jgi:hypothetical protein
VGKGGLALRTILLIAVSGLTHNLTHALISNSRNRGTAKTPGLEVPPAHSACLLQT